MKPREHNQYVVIIETFFEKIRTYVIKSNKYLLFQQTQYCFHNNIMILQKHQKNIKVLLYSLFLNDKEPCALLNLDYMIWWRHNTSVSFYEKKYVFYRILNLTVCTRSCLLTHYGLIKIIMSLMFLTYLFESNFKRNILRLSINQFY